MILRESMTVRDDSLGLLPRKDSLAVHNKWQIFRKSYLVLNYLPSADFGVSKFRTIEVGDSNWSLLVFIENIDKKSIESNKKNKMRIFKNFFLILTVVVLIKSRESDKNKKQIVEAGFWFGDWSLIDLASINLETLCRFIQMIQKLPSDRAGNQMNIKFKPIKNSERSWN